MQRNCTYCGEDFTAPSKPGRPPSMCSNECRLASLGDRRRICVLCNAKFHISTSAFPNHCSDVCHATDTANTCVNCRQPAEPNNRFCSAECLQQHYGQRTCNHVDCNNSVPMRLRPPFNRVPKYCSDECRGTAYFARTGQLPRANAMESDFASNLGSPIDIPPLKKSGHPFVGVHIVHVPKLSKATATPRCLASWDLYQAMLANDACTVDDLCYMGLQPVVFTPNALGLDRYLPWLPSALQRQIADTNLLRLNSVRTKGANYQNQLMRLLEYIRYFYDQNGLTPKQRQKFTNEWFASKPEFMGKSKLYMQCTNFLTNIKPIANAWIPGGEDTIRDYLFGEKSDLLEYFRDYWGELCVQYKLDTAPQSTALDQLTQYIEFVDSKEIRDAQRQ